MDTKANTYGKLLLELCKNTGLIIANGRIYQDKHILHTIIEMVKV